MIWLLTGVIVFLGVMLVWACVRIESLYARLGESEQSAHMTSHLNCVDSVAHAVSKAHAAAVLESAAEAIASMDGHADLSRIASTVWREGDSVPALWLRERAERLSG